MSGRKRPRVAFENLVEQRARLGVTALLWRRRKTSPFLFGEYMVLNGLGRFVVEIWRINARIGGLSEAQWIAIALVVGGGFGWWRLRARAAAAS